MANESGDGDGADDDTSTENKRIKNKRYTERVQARLENKDKLDKFLQAYYTFMNMDEFIYQENNTLKFQQLVIDYTPFIACACTLHFFLSFI